MDFLSSVCDTNCEALLAILNSLPDSICVKNSEHQWVLVNDKFCELAGVEREQLLGKTDYDFFLEEEAAVFYSSDDAVLSGGTESFSEESLTNATTGETVLLNTKKTLYRDGCGREFVIAIGRDITELQRMQKRIEHAQKMESLGTLAGGIAHDFNNILYPIVGMSELLLDDLPAGSPEYEYVQEILKAGRRGSDLVKQILAFSRLSEQQVIPVRPQQIVRDALKFCRAAIPSSIEILEEVQRDCGFVLADPVQLHQIAVNLITNAYQAVEEKGGTISITLREISLDSENLKEMPLSPGRYVMFEVADTGPGIDPSVVDRLFEPYFTTKEPKKGSGIALAVVYGIVKDHGGDIRVSTDLEKRTTFEVFIPLREEPRDAPTLPASEQAQTGTEKILLVDDEESVVKLEKDLLERLGYRVTALTKSSDALDVFEGNPGVFDLVITDMTMPGMSGDQLALQMISRRPDIPVIVCTGFSERINKERAVALGIQGFLIKPFSKSELAKNVREILDKAKD